MIHADAAAYLIENAPKEWQPTSCYGNSVGALNAAMVATGQHAEMLGIWANIVNRDVYRHNFGTARAIYSVISGRPMLDTSPLLDMLDDFLLGVVCKMPLGVQYVTPSGALETVVVEAGQAITDMHIRAIYNSTVIPFAFPVKYGGYDGGIFNPIPLDVAIDREEEGGKMVVLSAHPLSIIQDKEAPKRSTGHLVRTVELFQRGLIYQNVQLFERINGATSRATVPGFKHFDSLVVSPEGGVWWGMLDFDAASAEPARTHGRRLAQKALEAKLSLSSGT